jgi:hypothetical protein
VSGDAQMGAQSQFLSRWALIAAFMGEIEVGSMLSFVAVNTQCRCKLIKGKVCVEACKKNYNFALLANQWARGLGQSGYEL